MMPSPEMDVCPRLCLFAGGKRRSMWERFGFISLLEFMHLPTNPEAHGILFNPLQFTYELIHCDVTDLRFSQTLGAWWPLRLFPLPPHTPSEATNGPQTLVYRDLISRHPGRYVSDHKQPGGGKEVMFISRLFASIT